VDLVRELKPTIVVMILDAGLGRPRATWRIVALELDTRVLVLTMHSEEEYLVPVLEAGASGYLTKTTADRSLIEAIRIVARGEVYLPPQATKLLLREYKSAGSGDAAPERLHQLSTREQEVLALTAEGYSSKEIGEKLFISPKTVDTYRSRIMEKLGLNHRAELVRFALRVGLLKGL
jgi:two-component system response regulator NreC